MLEKLFGRNPFNYNVPTPEVKKQEYISLQLPLTLEKIENEYGDKEDSQIKIDEVFTLLEKIDGVIIHPQNVGTGKGKHKCVDIPVPLNDRGHQVFIENDFTFIVQPYEDHVIMFSKIHPHFGGEITILDKNDRFFIEHFNAYNQRVQENK